MKRLVLLGGGHAHLHLLRRLAQQPLAGWDVLLLTPQPRMLYSGMLPGWIAGHYALEQCEVDLERLAAAAGVRLVLDACTGLDAGARRLHGSTTGEHAWDVLSIDVGSACAQDGIAGAAAHAVPVRPFPAFVASWQALQLRLRDRRQPQRLVIVGAGPAGVELALAARHRASLEDWPDLQVHLLGSDAAPLPQAPAALQARVLHLLAQRGIQWQGGARAEAVTQGAVRLQDGTELPQDTCWLVTGPAAHAWLSTSGLASDAGGFIHVDAMLRSTSHGEVFAAGDAAAHPGAVPKSGVYAVRAGAVLAANVLAHCQGAPLAPWRPQARALYLLSTADERAIALWGRWHAEGRWLWRLKDGIDRRFVQSRRVRPR